MKKVCKKHGVRAYIWDQFVVEDENLPSSFEYDAVIVMTPHTGTQDLWNVKDFRYDCIIADLWKMFPKSKSSNSGIYKAGEVL